MSTETDNAVVLTLPAETVTNLAIIDEVEQMLIEVEEEYATVPDCSTKEGYDLAKERRRNLVKARTRGNQARLDATKPLREEKARIDDIWNKDYQPRLLALEEPHDVAIKAVDEAKERERQAKAEAEAQRVAAIEERIAAIKAEPASAVTLEQCAEALARLTDVDLADFAEFAEPAEHHIKTAKALLEERHAALVAHEEQRKAQEARQAELDRRQAEQDAAAEKLAQQQRDADAREQKIKDDEAAAEKKMADEAARIEAEAAAEKKRVEDEAAAEKQRIADEKQAEIDAAEKVKRDKELAKANAVERKAMAADVVKIDQWLSVAESVPALKSRAGDEIGKTIKAFLSDIAVSLDEMRVSEDKAA